MRNLYTLPTNYAKRQQTPLGDGDEGNGVFLVRSKKGIHPLMVIASDGHGWEHVSVSKRKRTPSWADMCLVKELFFYPHETVMQLHVPEDQWISNHAHCLHLWRPTDAPIPAPPGWMVGTSEVGEIKSEADLEKARQAILAETKDAPEQADIEQFLEGMKG